MAVSYSSITLPSLLYPQYRPPPLLPKPGKDNVRLQKLLKKSAKKKAAPQITHVPAPFRISLSPVNEASADLEHSDHSTPPRTPETPYYYHYGGTQPQAPRFTVRPLYQHVQSPYPQRAGFSRFSPQPAPAPSSAFPPYVAPLSSPVQQSYVIGVPSFQGSATPVPEVTRPPVKVTIVAPTPASQMAPKSPIPRPFIASGSESFLKPLTVLVPLGKPKSPRPTFIATETSRSPKPMFEVPQIRIYTANTSYYEPSRTPPVYDMTALTSIGSTIPTSKTPTSEVRRAITPTPEVKIVIMSSEVKIGFETPTGQTPSSATDPRSRTPTSEVNISVTPTTENKRALTVTADVKRAKSPTYDFSRARTPTGRPRTPYGTRAATPIFEVSRPNPLLFAVSLVSVEEGQPTASTPVSTHASSSTSQSVKSTEAQITKTTLNSKNTVNGDIHLDLVPVESTQGSISKPESAQQQAQVTDFTKAKTPPLPAAYQTPKTPTNATPKPTVVVPTAKPAVVEPTPKPAVVAPTPKPAVVEPTPKPAVLAPTGYQRPKTPTTATPKPAVAVPTGYQRPRSPYYGPSGPSPVALQRPKTPTSKSAYRGLTPAEYVAYGGIQSFTPAFGISRAKTPTQEDEISAALAKPTQPVKTHSLVEVFTMEDIAVDDTPAVIPTIVVSQASDVPKTTGPVTSHVVKTPEKQTVLQEKTCPTAEKVDVKPPEKERTTTPTQQVPKPKIPEVKQPVTTPVSLSDIKVPLLVKSKPVVKDTAKTTEVVTKTESQTSASQQKDSVKPSSEKAQESKPITPTLPAEGSTPVKALAKSIVNKVKDEKDASAVPSPAKKEADDSTTAAEPLLKALLKPKGAKSKLSGWGRLKKHMVVEQEEPKFPETEPQKEPAGHDQSEGQKDQKDEQKPSDKSAAGDETQSADGAKAPQMWNAVLFGMFSSKEKIMRQIELSKQEEDATEERPAEKTSETKDTEVPTFAHRLPVLLFSPRFDAKRLREAASRPVTKMSTVFEMGLIGRKNKEEEPKNTNRTARGFTVS